MGRWELRTEGCTVPLARDIESGEWIGHSDVANYFVDSHNADCDAYEARIAELEAGRERQREAIRDREKGELEACAEIDTITAELARVKAESLRVVADGDELIEDADTWRCLDNLLGLYCRERDLILIEGDEANRVRLERWETEE